MTTKSTAYLYIWEKLIIKNHNWIFFVKEYYPNQEKIRLSYFRPIIIYFFEICRQKKIKIF